jgi:hypothetical protein
VSAAEIDWPALLAKAWLPPDRDAVARCLDLVPLSLEYGATLMELAPGLWLGRCPFHSGGRSFTFYVRDLDDRGSQECGCRGCDFGTGRHVYDFVARAAGCSQAEVEQEVFRLIDSLRFARRTTRPDMPRSTW